MNTNISSITRELQSARTQAAARAAELRTELNTIEAHLARLDAALTALTGEKPKPLAKAASPNGHKATTTSSPKRADVIEAMVVVLAEAGVLETAGLKAQVEKQLTKDGFNRCGFAMRFKEACQEKLFVETPGGFRLDDEALSSGSYTLADGSQFSLTVYKSADGAGSTAPSSTQQQPTSITGGES